MAAMQTSEPVPASESITVATLPARDAHLLDFERRNWRSPGAKEEAIRVELELSAARYYQLLNAVIDSPAALRHDPMLIRRLRRLRDGRNRGAASGNTGSDLGA
jgi:hypothetical protein